MIKNSLIFFFTIVLFVSCAKPRFKNDNNEQITITEIYSENYKGLKNFNHHLITNSNDFNAELNLRRIEIQDFDFKSNTAVIIDAGERRSGGYGISLKDYSLKNDSLILNINITSPKPQQPVTMALTRPMVIYKINRPNIKYLIIQNNIQ